MYSLLQLEKKKDNEFYENFDKACKELKNILSNPKNEKKLQTIKEFLDEF